MSDMWQQNLVAMAFATMCAVIAIAVVEFGAPTQAGIDILTLGVGGAAAILVVEFGVGVYEYFATDTPEVAE